MRKLRPSLAAATVSLVLAAGNASAQFSNAWIFGDSLADAGQYGARFTTNPGLTFPEYLTQRYGITVGPSFQGGNDYAQGGARLNTPAGNLPPGIPNFSITQQVSLYLAKGPADPNALYEIDGGANDIRALATQFATGQITQAQLQAGVAQAAVDLVTLVARLQAAGARYIVLYNMPDIGKTPEAAAANAQAALTALSGLFNSTLQAGLASANLRVIQVNLFGMLNEIVANPAAFGFTNVTGVACTVASSLNCTPSTLVAPNAALTYAFADSIHPTTGLATIASQVAGSMIEGPAQMSSLAEAPLAVERANFRAMDARMISGISSSRPMSKFEAWAAYDYSNNDIKGLFLSGDADVNSIVAGGDIKLSERLLVGAIVGYTENKGDFGGGNGSYKLKETAGTIYAGYGGGPWYVGATLGAGNLDYGGIHRNITLGALNRTETGSTTGWHIMASVLGGYWFNATADWQHGPFARLAYQDVRVHGFSESGSDSTALTYGQQKRESLITSLGWQVSGRVNVFRPFARITWEYESRNNDRDVTATLVALPTPVYSIPGIKPDNNFFRYLVGASSDFGRVTGFITGEGTGSKSDGNGYAVTVGVRIPI